MEGGVLGDDLAVAEIAEAFAFVALEGVALDDRREQRDGVVDGDAGRDEAVEAGAVVLRAEIERVLVRRLADEADLGEIGARAAVGAAGDAQADGVVAQAGFVEDGFEFFQDFGQDAFAFGEGEAAGRQRDAGERVEPQAASACFPRSGRASRGWPR